MTSHQLPLSNSRAWALRLMAVGLGCAVALALAELATRFGPPLTERDYRETQVETSHTEDRKPDFRRRPYQLDKRPGVFRIVALGDSFTWGTGVYPADTYPDRLERRLNLLHPEQPIEVISWAYQGWNTAQEVESIRGELDRLQPDLLILGFVFNDAETSSYYKRKATWQILKRRKPQGGLGAFLYRRSSLFYVLYNRLENVRQRRDLTAFYHRFFEDGPDWQACVEALGELRALADRHGFRLLMVVFPLFDGKLDEGYPYLDLHQRIDATAKRLLIPALDLLPAFRGMETRRLAIDPFADPHPNELAHRIAADRILLYLLRQGQVPIPWPPPAASTSGGS